jgi:cyclic pyranopterin phosphate synthase
MPAEGLAWLPRAEMLTDEEFVRLAEVFVGLGIRSVRLTGGEPLLHRSVVGLVARLAGLTPRPELSLTTNGIGLSRTAADLVRAGLNRVNVSVDTLQRERFRELTRRDGLDAVLAGLAAAAAAGLGPIKVNAVLMRGSNLAEAPALLDWALRSGYQLRFIEHMPLDAQRSWSRTEMVSAAEMLGLLAEWYTLRPVGHGGPGGHAPAEDFDVLDGPRSSEWRTEPARVGVIASVTRPFCRDCDRLRLTADGQLRTCLFAQTETDLRGPLRDGADDDALRTLIQTAVAGKQAGHGIGSAVFVQPARPMSAIGG